MKEFASIIQLLENSLFYYIICANLQGNYSYVNTNYNHTFKYVDEDLKGKPYYITMHPDDRKVCEEVAYKCIENPGCVFPATIRKHDGKGGFIITQWEYKAMFDEAGELEGIFCIGHDVTELSKKADLLKEIAFHQSHNVRRPLANILGIVSIVSKMEIEESIRNLIDMLIENSNELDEVIKSTVSKTYE